MESLKTKDTNTNTFATRDGFGEGLIEAGKLDEKVLALCCDLTESTRLDGFKKIFRDRFIEVGVAEQNMAGLAAGLALEGFVPFMASYSVFSPGRNWDQIRVSICYSNLNVKIVGAHAGLSVGPDGATHQALEDIAITRVLPNMLVVNPCDSIEAKKATLAIAKHVGPSYIRLARSASPVITTEQDFFELGKANILQRGDKLTVISSGPILSEVLKAVKGMPEVELINLHTIKPIDKDAIIESAKKTGQVMTVEEHQIAGGVGSAVAEVLSRDFPVNIKMLGVNDSFSESGTVEQLWKKFGIDSESIKTQVLSLLKD
ncbi:MAG: transketolase family protein [bacterium]|nr:transketolase family protein [bacterium]